MKHGVRTAALMATLLVLMALVGRAIAGPNGMVIAFVIAIGLNFFSYWFSDKMVLTMYRAQEVDKSEHPDLYRMVDKLRKQADLPMPKLYIVPSEQPNAFATGRNPDNAVVAVTEGILQMLPDEELEGVIAHELAHVKNRDILISSIAATIASAVTLIARFGIFFGGGRDRNMIASLLMLILAPIAAMLIQMAISRSREFVADRDGAEICRKPRALANALQRLEKGVEARPMQSGGESTAHMFIVNPFSGLGSGIRRLFSSHPPTEERVERLMDLERSGFGG